ncbi:MAG: 4-hydroxy-3-methylbut-2-enyl diphosphate reductase, partial [Clostridia bacterium]|nr:4-hydroxy-3-methylbut-2-enyl diphosphate reductase [Clostridia bacterium]
MEIIVAKNGGFCRGVRNAVDTAMSISPKNTYIYGEIIHNPDVVREICNRGIKTVENLDEVPNGATLIIRSHGVGKAVYEECERRDIKVVDCTCVFVKRTQNIVKERYEAGDCIVVIGEKKHPEVVGINGWCENTAYIFSSPDEDFSVLPDKRLCVVAQTTYSNEKFEKIVKNLNHNGEKTVEVFKTICYTTIGRQNEADELSRSCDAVLVIGGLNSSNTNKLYVICAKHCDFVFRLENAADFDYKNIKRFKKVGVVTGASTPDMQTQEVLNKMAELAKEAEATMDEVVAQMDNQQKFSKGMMLKATISSANAEGVDVLLPNTKKEVKLDKNEVDCEVYNADEFAAKVGEEIELMVVSVNPVKLSQKAIAKAKEEEALVADIKDGKEFSVVCTGCNKGGLTAEIGSYAVFVPAREIRSGFVKELDKYVGKKLRLKVLEIKTERRKEIIASQKA